jgi:putative ABC transport system permease protein
MRQWLTRIARRVRALIHETALERELDAEMQHHVAMEADDLMRTQGLEPDEARRRALVAFGGVERYKEAHRDARGVRWIGELVQDVRYAVRSLIRAPAFSISAVLVLALGIGASAAVFSAVDAVLLTHLPYPHDDRLIRIYEQNSPTNRWGLSQVDLEAIEHQGHTLSAVGGVRWLDVTVSSGVNLDRARAGFATSGFFRALGVRPVRGRPIEPRDERAGAPAVVLVSHRFAMRTFGGDANAVGRTITIDGTASTIVGVLPPGANALAGLHAEIWPVLHFEPPTRRGPFGLLVVGRLADGASLTSVRRELDAISVALFDAWPSFQDRVARLTPVPLREAILGNAGHTLGMLAAAVALVLLISVANVASLMLVRATGRWREVVLRTVLGATRGRLVRLLVTESLVLAGTGAVAGIGVGVAGLGVLKAIGPTVPRLDAAQLDARAIAFAIGLALVAGIIVGAYPVLLLLGRDAAPALRDGDRTVGAGRHTHAIRSAFVVAEFALALPVLAGAALLLNSFMRLQRVNPGFDPAHLVALRVALPSARYANDSAIAAYWARGLPLVRSVPGVVQAALGEAMPPDEVMNINNFDLIEHPVPPGGAQPTAPWVMVGRDYFRALGVPLLDGRLFTPSDTGAAPVVIVSRAWAEHYFPDGTAIGQRLVSGGCTTCPLTTVVGIAGDVKYQGLGASADAVYEPLTQGWSRDLNLFVRTSGAPQPVVDRVRATLRSLDPGIPLDEVVPLEDRVHASIAQPRHLTTLLGGFAIAAVALAAVGIFGMLSYMVNARQREIGVRMALGAPHRAVVRMIVRRGMTHAVAGAMIGLVVALVGTRWLAGALFNVGTTDPVTLTTVTVLLLGVACIACWLPARRAAGIDPAEAIRMD